MLVAYLRWLQDTGFFSYIRNSTYAYPILLSLHLVALALFGGMILMTDLRLLGLGLRSYSVADVVKGLRGPKRFGLILAAACGVLMFGAKSREIRPNRFGPRSPFTTSATE